MLREATASRHAALDAAVSAADYFGSVSGYSSYLERMLAFHTDFALHARQIAPDLAARFKLKLQGELLAADVRACGADRRPLSIDLGPHFELRDRAMLIGALYVVIGSSLGARLLVTWARKLPAPASRAVSYLEHLSQSCDWPEFVSFLEAEANLDETRLIAGAEATFRAVHRLLGAEVPA